MFVYTYACIFVLVRVRGVGGGRRQGAWGEGRRGAVLRTGGGRTQEIPLRPDGRLRTGPWRLTALAAARDFRHSYLPCSRTLSLTLVAFPPPSPLPLTPLTHTVLYSLYFHLSSSYPPPLPRTFAIFVLLALSLLVAIIIIIMFVPLQSAVPGAVQSRLLLFSRLAR